MKRIIDVGIDVGSTTVKLIAMYKDKILFKDYQRHFSNTLKTIERLMQELLKKVGKSLLGKGKWDRFRNFLWEKK